MEKQRPITSEKGEIIMKNFIQDGKTIIFTVGTADTDHDIQSGEAFTRDGITIISYDTYKKGCEGLGYCEGVYEIPKAPDVNFMIGNSISIKNNQATPLEKGQSRAGVVWENAEKDAKKVRVKINI